MSGRRVHDKPCGFVDDDEIRIFINDRQRQRLSGDIRFARRRQFDPIGGARFDRRARLSYRSAGADVAVVNQRLDAGSAQVFDLLREPAIEALTGILCGGSQLDRVMGFRSIWHDQKR